MPSLFIFLIASGKNNRADLKFEQLHYVTPQVHKKICGAEMADAHLIAELPFEPPQPLASVSPGFWSPKEGKPPHVVVLDSICPDTSVALLLQRVTSFGRH
jgi:hypothetical protein